MGVRNVKKYSSPDFPPPSPFAKIWPVQTLAENRGYTVLVFASVGLPVGLCVVNISCYILDLSFSVMGSTVKGVLG